MKILTKMRQHLNIFFITSVTKVIKESLISMLGENILIEFSNKVLFF